MAENFPDKKDLQLIKAFEVLKSKTEIQNFLRDLLTLAEIKEAANRFEIAKLLWTTKKSYIEIASETKASTTTVGRVAEWLFKKNLLGYQTVLKRLFQKAK